MLTFVARRLLATLLVLVAASFVVYYLTALGSDPLQDLKGSNSPNRQELIDARIDQLNLDQPIVVRYADWLVGASKCLIGQCDLGVSFSRGDQPVTEAVAGAAVSTIQLITGATILAIIFGLAVGMITALRQYSGFDYGVTLLTFVLYSLPIFWVAVLLKEYGAIRFNEFLSNPDLPLWVMLVIGVVAGLIWASIAGGTFKNRAIVFGASAAATFLLLATLIWTGWFLQPSIGLLGIFLLGTAATVVVNLLSTGLRNRRALYSSLATVVFFMAAWYPLQWPFLWFRENIWIVFAVVILGVGVGIGAGYLFGKDDKRELARTAAIVGGLTGAVVIIDRVLLVYPEYLQKIPLKNGVIATIGSSTPGLNGDIWITMLDTFTHLLLPTIALTLISFAAYTRYSRSSLLEVMNQDYVRTARAKGLNERTVIMRHAFRNAMIPIATIIAFDIGALIGGAIITESIFAWKGMGSLFSEGLEHGDVNLVMGFFVLTGLVAVVFNIIADIVYSTLDPRIRVS